MATPHHLDAVACPYHAREGSAHEQDALLEVLGHAQRECAPVQGLAVVYDLDVAPAGQASPVICMRFYVCVRFLIAADDGSQAQPSPSCTSPLR